MMKKKSVFRCSECGYESHVWSGKCSSCGSWGTVEEHVARDTKKNTPGTTYKEATKLADIKSDDTKRYNSGIAEFDRVIGGGLVKDSVSILTAVPGAGKSTLLLELSKAYAQTGLKVLYITGEESESQIKDRANRIMAAISENIWIIATGKIEEAKNAVQSIDPDIIFLDSIQTMTDMELSSRAGSPLQTIGCTEKLVEIAKGGPRPKAIIMVGHMTKSDEMAGLRTLEHLVDTVIRLQVTEGDELRILTSTKNRFGRTGEIGLFKMTEFGMKEVENPSEEFITKRNEPVPGSATAMVREGSRFIAVEIESLVSGSFSQYPTRIGDSLNKDRLNTLIAILEQRAKLKFFDKNVVIKTTGGLSLKERDCDLAVIMSIASSYFNKPVDMHTAFVAEVGLTGELKRVKQLEYRVRELARLGYDRILIPDVDIPGVNSIPNLKLVKIRHLVKAIDAVFGA